MGVLTDYFRAPDAGAAKALLVGREGGPTVAEPGLPTVDALEARGVDPDVVLGGLVATILAVPWTTDLARTRLVSPDESDADALADGPWLFELTEATRDTLASVEDEQVPAIADGWATTEELDGYVTGPELRPGVTDLSALARRAAAEGDLLYCWVCL